MKSKIGIIALILITIGVTVSCHRKKESFIGPEYVGAPSDFYVVNNSFKADTHNINFETSNVYFISNFSTKVNYFLTIKGLQSGAIKRFSGINDHLDVSNTNWTGSHDEMNFFQMNEKAAAELTFLGSSIVLRDTVTIVRAKRYTGPNAIVLADDAAPASFEGFEGTFNFNSPTWTYGVFKDAGELSYGNVDPNVPQFQGKNAFSIKGTDLNHSYFVAGLKRHLDSTSEYKRIPTDPDQVYVNIFLYGTGNPNSYINYTFEESETGAFNHVDNKDDAYSYQFGVGHTGWKMFYVKYSQLTRATDPNYGGNGNGIREPNKLRSVAFDVISSPAGNTVGITFDFPIITFGKPFNPNE